jgi:cardiolipin synthase A/B
MKWRSEKLFFDQESYFANILSSLDSAQISVELESYIFVPQDPIGQQVVEKLVEVAERGVKVRVLIDAIGSIFWQEEIIVAFSGTKVEYRFFRGIWWRWWRLDMLIRKLKFLNQRLHRKIVLIDNKILFLGSFNITDKASRETGVQIASDHFSELQQSFFKIWRKRWHFRRPRFHISLLLRFNEGPKVRRIFNRDLAKRIRHSQHRVWITNAYFVPPLFMVRALLKAAENGVDVKILLPETSDLPLFKAVTVTFYKTLLAGKVKIFEYRKSFLHAKSLLIDDWALVGSSNFNYRSFLHDLEIDVVLEHANSIEAISTQFGKDLESAIEVTNNSFKGHQWLDRMLGWILLKFRNWL